MLAAAVTFFSLTLTEGPCDILNDAGNECVAAHSTVRALYAKYDGPLYNVTRASDGKSQLINVLQAGGFADKSSHDKFCSALDCVISNVMDQSGNGNHLGQRHKLINASRHIITVGSGTEVYGMWFDPGFGYHVDQTKNIATGNDPESIYAVMSGKNYNGGCCFDYGNSETDDNDDGCGTMEAIYFGNAHWAGNTGAGSTGPWAGADLEQGMYYGGGAQTKINNQSKPLTHDFVSLSLKGRTDGFTIKGGDATAGALQTMYDGPRPDTTLAGTCGSGSGRQITLQQCSPGNSSQVWGFLKDGKSIASQNSCLDINGFAKNKGADVWAYPCGHGSKDNEFWEVKGGTIPSLQADTPFCLGMTGASAGSTAHLDDCTAPNAQFTVGFTAPGTNGTIVQKSSGLCLTKSPGAPIVGYQPMRKKGAIILATGGDNSNSAKGNFYEGFMATGYASDATDAAIQANIISVGYSGFSPPQ